jgi:hypothetical protein
MDSHLKCAKDFYTLSIDIYKTLELSRELRGEDGKEYLNKIYAQYQKLMENSQLLKKRVKDDLTNIDKNNIDSIQSLSQSGSASSLSTPSSSNEVQLNIIA